MNTKFIVTMSVEVKSEIMVPNDALKVALAAMLQNGVIGFQYMKELPNNNARLTNVRVLGVGLDLP